LNPTRNSTPSTRASSHVRSNCGDILRRTYIVALVIRQTSNSRKHGIVVYKYDTCGMRWPHYEAEIRIDNDQRRTSLQPAMPRSVDRICGERKDTTFDRILQHDVALPIACCALSSELPIVFRAP